MVNIMKKKKEIITVIIITIILVLGTLLIYTNKSNLIKLSYDEIIEKLENKDDFVLCVSASECVHCQSYKPKLKKVANNYDIKIYYTDIDSFTDEEYEKFKKKISFDGGTPVTIFFKDGDEKTTATRIEGDVKIEKIINKLKQNGFITE